MAEPGARGAAWPVSSPPRRAAALPNSPKEWGRCSSTESAFFQMSMAIGIKAAELEQAQQGYNNNRNIIMELSACIKLCTPRAYLLEEFGFVLMESEAAVLEFCAGPQGPEDSAEHPPVHPPSPFSPINLPFPAQPFLPCTSSFSRGCFSATPSPVTRIPHSSE